MKAATEKIMRTVLDADETVSAGLVEDVLAVLKDEAVSGRYDPNRPLVVTQAQAARLLGVHRCARWRLVKRGKIRRVSVAGLPRYPLEDLKRMAQGEE